MTIKNYIINKLMNSITELNKDFEKEKLLEIKYGLESIYLTITKIFVITLIAFILGIFKEYIILLILFNILRFTAFGIHANKSWQCWIASTFCFIVMPIICLNIKICNFYYYLISLFCLLIFLIYSPSDTPKRPLINKKKRIIYKCSTVSLCFIYIFISYKIENNYVHNAILASMIIESILIHPLTYKIFKIPYNNYKTYELSKN